MTVMTPSMFAEITVQMQILGLLSGAMRFHNDHGESGWQVTRGGFVLRWYGTGSEPAETSRLLLVDVVPATVARPTDWIANLTYISTQGTWTLSLNGSVPEAFGQLARQIDSASTIGRSENPGGRLDRVRELAKAFIAHTT